MKTFYLPFVFLMLLGCASIDLNSICKVNYTVAASGDYDLTRSWKLIGFQNNNDPIRYPPCSDNSYESLTVTLSFADTIQNLERSPYEYPYLLSGKGPINSYSGSYQTDPSAESLSGKISIQDVISTLMGGRKDLSEYERAYFDALLNAERFEINVNVLTIFYSSSDKLLFVALE